jgi:hypothetical protein
MVRFGKWQLDFHRPGAGDPEINIDQSKNLLEVERGNDLLAALCIAYAFDKALCQPMVTIVGYQEKEHMDDDDDSLDEFDPSVVTGESSRGIGNNNYQDDDYAEGKAYYDDDGYYNENEYYNNDEYYDEEGNYDYDNDEYKEYDSNDKKSRDGPDGVQ